MMAEQTTADKELLETERLLLEPLRVDHAAALHPLLLDEALYRFIPTAPPVSLGTLAARYARLERRRSPDGRERWLNWAMRRRDDAAYVGTLEATVFPAGRALIAYLVVVPAQGRGFGREGVGRMLTRLHEAYGVETATAEIDTRNAASIALVERLGFQRVDFRAAADHFKGEPSDEYRYELRLAGPGRA